MASSLEFMGKPKSTPGGTPARASNTERRSSRRCKINQLMRIRPSDPERDPFDDIRGSMSVSRTGVFFPVEPDRIRSGHAAVRVHALLERARGDDARISGGSSQAREPSKRSVWHRVQNPDGDGVAGRVWQHLRRVRRTKVGSKPRSSRKANGLR